MKLVSSALQAAVLCSTGGSLAHQHGSDPEKVRTLLEVDPLTRSDERKHQQWLKNVWTSLDGASLFPKSGSGLRASKKTVHPQEENSKSRTVHQGPDNSSINDSIESNDPAIVSQRQRAIQTKADGGALKLSRRGNLVLGRSLKSEKEAKTPYPTASPVDDYDDYEESPTKAPKLPKLSKVQSLRPTSVPSGSPSSLPSSLPSMGSIAPTDSPAPSGLPSATPSKKPSSSPSNSQVPSATPSNVPSQSAQPSKLPSAVPSLSAHPSAVPSDIPSQSGQPSATPSTMPSQSAAPSEVPSTTPSLSQVPSIMPSSLPSESVAPSSGPSATPSLSAEPSAVPSHMPSVSIQPSRVPSSPPSLSQAPSSMPSGTPSLSIHPSATPSSVPSHSMNPSSMPSGTPSESMAPSSLPSSLPSLSMEPSSLPSSTPSLSGQPSSTPSAIPSASAVPSATPSSVPSLSMEPSSMPSFTPSESMAPSRLPSNVPSLSLEPSSLPSSTPSVSSQPSSTPSAVPSKSAAPSATSSSVPSLSNIPSRMPSGTPSESMVPSSLPSNTPSLSAKPSATPSSVPSLSSAPSKVPSTSPSESTKPSAIPSSVPSVSQVPSLVPSDAPSVKTCPASTVPAGCFTGNATAVTQACADNNATCCEGTQACEWTVDPNYPDATPVICPGACNGEQACKDLGPGSFIDMNACVGSYACRGMAGMAIQSAADGRCVTASVGNASCLGAYACQYIGSSSTTAQVSIGDGSCFQQYGAFLTCSGVGRSSPVLNTVRIGTGSCVGYGDCRNLAGTSTTVQDVFLGDNACASGANSAVDASCNSVGYNMTGTSLSIANDACSALQGCPNVGRLAKNIDVGKGSCTGQRSCTRLGSSTFGDVSIGANSCNVILSCFDLALGAGPGDVQVGNSSCIQNDGACLYLARDTTAPNVSIGNGVCDDVGFQCAGIPTGNLNCLTTSYLADYADGCPTPMPSSMPSNAPSISMQPSLSNQPSRMPSTAPSTSSAPSVAPCPASTVPVGCFNGTAVEVTTACADNNASCCVGTLACDWVVDPNHPEATPVICPGACNGEQACNGLGPGSFIDMDSCVGDFACQGLAGMAVQLDPASFCVPATVGAGSCIGVDACRQMAASAMRPTVVIGSNSCIYTGTDEVCGYMARDSPNVARIDIGNYACRGYMDCRNIAKFSTTVEEIYIGNYACVSNGTTNFYYGSACHRVGESLTGDTIRFAPGACTNSLACAFSGLVAQNISFASGSCLGNAACTSIGPVALGAVSVGYNSCGGLGACFGAGQNSVADVIVGGNASCLENSACRYLGADAASLNVGDFACADSVSQCSGYINATCRVTDVIADYGTYCPGPSV